VDQDQLNPYVAYEGYVVRVPHNPLGGGTLLKRNAQLDALRALSFLLVLIAHLGFQHIVPGGLGVTIFFGISGYIITALILKEHQDFGNVDLRLFYIRRFWKIAPPLFFLVVIPSLITWKFYSISLQKFLSQLFFFFNWNQIYHAPGKIFPPSGLVWSLSIEEQYYIGIAFFVMLLQIVTLRQNLFRQYLAFLMCTIWLLSTLSRMLIAIQDHPNFAYGDTGNLPRIYIGTDTRISSIACGALVAILASNEHKRSKLIKFLTKQSRLALTTAILFFLTSVLIRDQFFRDTFRYLIQEIAIVLILITGPVLNSWPKSLQFFSSNLIVQNIGRSSYSLYLSHAVVLLAINTIFSSVALQINMYIWRALCATICILMGFAAHRCFDSPFESKRISARRAK
jgi:peptidoglycan/LPS O-acetylase OafA/YrhL